MPFACHSPLAPLTPPHARQPLIYVLLHRLAYAAHFISTEPHNMRLRFWLLSLSAGVPGSPTLRHASGLHPSRLPSDWPCAGTPHFIYPFTIRRTLGFSHSLAVIINATTNTCVQVHAHVWCYFSWAPTWGGISGSSGNRMFNFTSPPATYVVSPQPCQHLLLPVFLITAILVSVKVYLPVVWVCTSLMVDDVQYLLLYLLAMCIYLFIYLY